MEELFEKKYNIVSKTGFKSYSGLKLLPLVPRAFNDSSQWWILKLTEAFWGFQRKVSGKEFSRFKAKRAKVHIRHEKNIWNTDDDLIPAREKINKSGIKFHQWVLIWSKFEKYATKNCSKISRCKKLREVIILAKCYANNKSIQSFKWIWTSCLFYLLYINVMLLEI